MHRPRFRRLAALVLAAGLLGAAPSSVSANSAPATPSDISIISARYRFIAVWNPVATATGYIMTATSGGSTYTCTTQNTRCAITGLPNAQLVYSITVRAKNASGASAPTAPVVRASWYHPDVPSDLNLAGKNMSGLDLSTANLTGADLSNANLSGSNLTGAYLRNVNIAGANFSNTVLNDVISRGVSGTPAVARTGYTTIGGFLVGPRVNLWNQDLSGLNLSGISLWRAHLSGANLTGANLTNTNLASTIMQGTNFTNANLSRTNLSRSIANGANFTGTSLTTANLTAIRAVGISGAPTLPASVRRLNNNLVGRGFSLYQANLAGANLSGMDLTGTNFVSANLSNANLANTTLTTANFAQSLITGASGSGITGAPMNLPKTHRITAGSLQAN